MTTNTKPPTIMARTNATKPKTILSARIINSKGNIVFLTTLVDHF
ncbi:uncharacterized protein METZ01_LOCUS86211 [marine metagenome]|uniref:Uncharacterized protein n=1 Tax=marine metagenome TaxID=408172 RepID=A0A381V177_9ZZZZ